MVALLACAITAGIIWGPVGGVLLGAVGAAGTAVTRGVWKWHHERIVRGLGPRVAALTTGFDERYRQYVLATARYVDVKGLATMGFAAPELDDVYVHVGLGPQSLHKAASALVGGEYDSPSRRDIVDFLDGKEPAFLAVVGPPGSGKTTLLRHTARRACDSRKRRRSIPVLVVLREHWETIRNGRSLAHLITSSLGALSAHAPPGWADHHLLQGHCLVLFDGIDEIARVEDRKAVANWIERQSREYPRNDFVLTSRPQGYREAQVDGAQVLQTLPFTVDQVRAFVHGWYLAVERLEASDPLDAVKTRSAAAAEDLLTRLESVPALVELTPNPLLLTMIANVHRFRGALPGSRADLYREMCEVALWRRNEAKGLPQQLSGNKREVVLRALAYRMMEAGVQVWPRDLVLAEFVRVLRRFTTTQGAEQVLADITSNGLLVELEADQLAFAHLTFQEYLAAAYVRDAHLVDALAERVDDSWWRETILLYAAMVRGDEIVAACLMVGGADAINLAFECADNDADLDPELRRRLSTWLRATMDDRIAMQDRHQRAQVLVVRDLRAAVPLSPSVSLCLEPLSDDVLANTPVTIPAAGISSATASALAKWADLCHRGRGRSVRLPRPDEVANSPLGSADTGQAIWVEDPGSRPFLWWSGDRHPHLVTGADILTQVDHDLDTPLSTAASEAAWELRATLAVSNDEWRFARQLAAMPELAQWRATDEPAFVTDAWAAVAAAGAAFSGWRLRAFSELASAITPFIDHDRVVTGETARSIRILGLILARAAEGGLRNQLIALTSVITLLEQRAGARALPESVHLAVEKRA
ncbi:NACHT domain-containing NTPase [Actinokineospora sp. UTMC 2448]|uniref:NACHT domain-containing protein n=1 Tax=Actinokineospora sp. UTMC 2448 TaxID=2268449 RepID=UPI00216498C3|nr:NACHT domain-containing protein [Actinokineospora sp. UTMC 2448]